MTPEPPHGERLLLFCWDAAQHRVLLTCGFDSKYRRASFLTLCRPFPPQLCYNRFLTMHEETVAIGGRCMEWAMLLKLQVPQRAGCNKRWNAMRHVLNAAHLLYYGLRTATDMTKVMSGPTVTHQCRYTAAAGHHHTSHITQPRYTVSPLHRLTATHRQVMSKKPSGLNEMQWDACFERSLVTRTERDAIERFEGMRPLLAITWALQVHAAANAFHLDHFHIDPDAKTRCQM